MDESAIKDIAEVVTVDKDLFSPEESSMLGQSHAIQVKDKHEIKLDEEEEQESDNLSRAAN